MLSCRPASFRDYTQIDYDYRMKYPHLLSSNSQHCFQRLVEGHPPPMQIKTWSLESMAEPFVFPDAQSSALQHPSNPSFHFNPSFHHSAIPARLMALKGEPMQLRSGPHTDVSFNQISSFDIEYALLEQTLRKDKTSIEETKGGEEGASDKSSSPPVLEPEFHFGDILGDEAIPPQPLVSNCKLWNKIQVSEDEKVGINKSYVEYDHRLHLSDGNHPECPVGAISNAPENDETDLSTAIASIVSSHVSNESISPRPTAQCREKQDTACSSQSILQRGSKRRAPESGADYPSKFARQARHKGWPSDWNGERKQFSEPESNRRPMSESVTTELLYTGRSEIPQQSRAHGESAELFGECEGVAESPASDSSTSGPGIRSHPDLYENLSADIREKVDSLRKKISGMPRRKLRESLAQGVSLEDIEPLMCLNRDELAGMLEIGVTTLKMFVHNTLGVPRWPARALKSQQVKMQKLMQKKMEAERKGDQEQARRVQRDLCRMIQGHMRGTTEMAKHGKRGVTKVGWK